MKYYITKSAKEIEGYKRLKYSANVDYDGDVLLFDDINFANKFRYYYDNNRIEVMLKKKDLKRRHQIKSLLVRNPNTKWILPKSIVGKLIFIWLIFWYTISLKIVKGEKQPIHITVGNLAGEDLYILDNKVINGTSYSQEQNTTHYWKKEEEIPFKEYELIHKDIKVHEIKGENEIWYAEDFDYVIVEGVFKKVNFKPIAYIYNCVIEKEETYIDVFYQNYMHLKKDPVITANVEFEVIDNEIDAQYYSKLSAPYKKNFKRIKVKTTDKVKINISYRDRYMTLVPTRKVFNKQLIGDKRIKMSRVSFYIDKVKLPEKYLKREIKYAAIKSQPKERPIYLFQDRSNKADDNAESLYRYYRNNNPGVDIYYAIEENTNCYNRLKEEGFNLIDFGSKEHKEIYLRADKLLTSHAARRIYDPFYPKKLHRSFEEFKFVFLQHGMIMGRHHGFLDYINNQIDLFITSSVDERELVKDFSAYENVVDTGLARFDNYADSTKGDFVIYAPSWNTLYADDLENSPYLKEIEEVVNNKTIIETLKQSGLSLKLILHPEFIELNVPVRNDYGIEIAQANTFNYKVELKTCHGLLTDYSSLFFDILYQGKFVIHHQPYELHHANDQVTNFFGSIDKTTNIEELEQVFKNLAARNWEMSSEQYANLDNVFSNRDSNNCKRTQAAIEVL